MNTDIKNKQANMHLQSGDVAIPEVLVDSEDELELKRRYNGEEEIEEESEAEIDYSCAIPEIHIKKAE
ncbi:MAG: hypothetical protein MJ105_04760 [Lachnospiraceae bacterium]|nr:hypothetical protein [Lachnospiraceae bacterium]